jgi:hypothetical protein
MLWMLTKPTMINKDNEYKEEIKTMLKMKAFKVIMK